LDSFGQVCPAVLISVEKPFSNLVSSGSDVPKILSLGYFCGLPPWLRGEIAHPKSRHDVFADRAVVRFSFSLFQKILEIKNHRQRL
jgi:hypothetical protein